MIKNSEIKIAIFDIDDTLIPRGSQDIIPSALESIKILQANGIEVLIATGRATYFIQDPILNVVKPNYLITINGACVFDHEHEIVYRVPMDRDECNALLDYSRQHNLAFATKMIDDMSVFSGMDLYQTVYLKGSPKGHILIDRSHQENFGPEDELPMGIFMMGDEATIEASEPLAPNGKYAKAYADAYDVYSKHAGKIKGIEFVLDKLDASWNNVIAFGDAANDLDMLKHAAIGVAMGNAPQSVKDQADYTTDHILEDGIKKSLKHFNLI